MGAREQVTKLNNGIDKLLKWVFLGLSVAFLIGAFVYLFFKHDMELHMLYGSSCAALGLACLASAEVHGLREKIDKMSQTEPK
jgi:hypothetical protein